MFLTAEGCRLRRERLWRQVDNATEILLLADPQHVTYFSGYYQPPFVFRTTNAGAVLILTRDSSLLVADNLVAVYAERAHVDDVVTPTWYRGVESAPHREAMLVRSVLERLRSIPGTRIGLEMAKVPTGIVAELRDARAGLRTFGIDPIIHSMKRVKDGDELEVLRRSMDAGSEGHRAALANVRPGMTEFEVYLLVQNACLRAAGEQAIVYGDFVSGERCHRERGGPPTHRIIEKGDLVLLDFSVVLGGYRGDFANTFVCGAKPPAAWQRLYRACLDAMQAAELVATAGRPARDVDAAVRASFDEKHLRESFVTHSGHGLGLGHPDPPYLVPESSDTLVEGDVIAIEPGQYVDGVAGMRFEHNYLVTQTGLRRLSNHELTLEQPA